MWIPFHHGGMGGHRAYAAAGMIKVLVVFAAFVLAVLARYVAMLWAEREFHDPARANLIGWLAFFAVLIVIGVGGVKLL